MLKQYIILECIILFALLTKSTSMIISIVIIIIIFIYLNSEVLKRTVSQVPNMMTFKERNFDYLIIGDVGFSFNLDCARSLSFTAPERTLFASELIFKRMFSYLKDGGSVIFITKKKYLESRKISFLDIPFLHPITRIQYHVSEMTKFPLFFHPLLSFKYLHQTHCEKKYTVEIPIPENLEKFCEERNIKCMIKIES